MIVSGVLLIGLAIGSVDGHGKDGQLQSIIDSPLKVVKPFGGKVLKGSIVDKKLTIEYGEGWEAYLHDKDHREFKDMVKTLHEQMASGERGG